uniref:Uncharacterized protein n=1 Tax=Tanacetum cinerariifolium TaxID=118510 RepID=A0A6L2MMN1_TANCI|nr:hypothetical protein [Tanacetum cinerariifolium]
MNAGNPKQNPNPKPKPNPNFTSINHTKPQPVKPSFASIIHRNPKPTGDSSLSTNVDTVVLNNNDLIRVDDSLTIILMKLKDVDSMSNMYMICRNEGFVDLKRHHFGRLWTWIQFPTPLKSIYSSIELASPSFKVDEPEESIAMISGRVCISTKSHNLGSERVQVDVHEVMFKVQVHGINIIDDFLDTSSSFDVNDIDKVADSVEENSLDDLNDLHYNLN